jgi:Fe-Mn family superoxide dismutase
MTYEAKTFTITGLSGISQKSIEEHIALYNGYVKNFNAIAARLAELRSTEGADANVIAELVRRHSFEFDGMRLHELYFPQLEGGAKALSEQSPLASALVAQFGSLDALLAALRATAQMRGPGWALLYYDAQAACFHIGFSGEQHQGHFATLPILFALDVWEHAYILDHGASGKGNYLDAFFASINWGVCEERFAALR